MLKQSWTRAPRRNIAAFRDPSFGSALANGDRVKLADGSICIFHVYEGKVIWDGKVRKILVDEADADPLVGMRLMKGYELNIQVRYHGRVSIKRLSRKQKRESRRG